MVMIIECKNVLIGCWIYDRSVAQLVEFRSPKPEVAGSIPVAPAGFCDNKCV